MKPLTLISFIFVLALRTTTASARQPPSSKAVLLSNIQSLTLRADRKTSHRRVSAIPQLKCIGGNAKGKFEVDAMRCTNQGSSYSGADVEWSCTASLPEEFKLGSTDIICEGYSSPDDDYVLKGSCGAEYRLILTAKGEEKYASSWFRNTGSSRSSSSRDQGFNDWQNESSGTDKLVSTLFWVLFIGVLCWMIYSAFTQRDARPRQPGRRQNPRPWGGGGGGGGGGGSDDDPPPPYDYQPPRGKPTYSNRSANQGWRPGFWSGLGTGGAAGYAAGRMAGRGNDTFARRGTGGGAWGNRDNGGEGSSGTRSSSSTDSSTRYSSTGFGSTSRR